MFSIIWVSAKHWILEAQGDAKIQQNKTYFIYSFLFLIFYWTSEPGREATDNNQICRLHMPILYIASHSATLGITSDLVSVPDKATSVAMTFIVQNRKEVVVCILLLPLLRLVMWWLQGKEEKIQEKRDGSLSDSVKWLQEFLRRYSPKAVE